MDSNLNNFNNNILTASNTGIMNGMFTIQNKLTGKHETFRVETKRKGKYEGKRVVSHMETSVNYAEYKWFGFVVDGKIQVFQKQQVRKEDGKKSEYVCYAALLEDLFGNGEKFAAKYELMGSVDCARCNRPLTNPSSVALLYGKDCAVKLGLDVKPSKKRAKAA